MRSALLLTLPATLALVSCDDTSGPGGENSFVEPSANCAVIPESDQLRSTMLNLVNSARARSRMCGSVEFAATDPITWSCRLEEAAQAHSADMAQNDFFDHSGSDGSTVSVRVTRTGYSWSMVGENIAGGQTTAQEVMQSWLDSPGHCENIMDPSWEHFGVSFAEDASSTLNIYWTQVFAVSRGGL